MIAHPPCTYLASSGARWWPNRRRKQWDAVSFVLRLLRADIPMIALENPVGLLSTVVRRPDQIIQPWMFGHSQDKRTCLWLKNLPLLRSTKVVPRGRRIYYESGKSLPEWYANISPSNRGKLRSVTYAGIAEAMAEQWGE